MFIRQRWIFLFATATVAFLYYGCSDNGIGGAIGEQYAEQYAGQTYGTNNCGKDGTAGSCKTANIGGKTWMAENLNRVPSSGNSWCYENIEYNCQIFGRLYDWNTAKTVCPTGWHLPTRDEWRALVDSVGGYSVAGKKLKSTSGWYNNGNGTDQYGFSALPGGYRRSDGDFNGAGYYGDWWTATESSEGGAYGRSMGYGNGLVYENDNDESVGFSARCVQD